MALKTKKRLKQPLKILNQLVKKNLKKITKVVSDSLNETKKKKVLLLKIKNQNMMMKQIKVEHFLS